MGQRFTQDKANLIAAEYMSNGCNEIKALVSCGYNEIYANNFCKRIFERPMVRQAVSKIQMAHTLKTQYTLDDYLNELDAAKQRAIDLKQPSAEISAIIAKGRSQGYDKDNDISAKQEIKPLSDEERAILMQNGQLLTKPELKLRTA